jgi:hypothetical protein
MPTEAHANSKETKQRCFFVRLCGKPSVYYALPGLAFGMRSVVVRHATAELTSALKF